MSSEMSSIALCTGRFFTWLNMMKPMMRPTTAMPMPPARNVEPAKPWIVTSENFGSTMSPSPASARGAQSSAPKKADNTNHHERMKSSRNDDYRTTPNDDPADAAIDLRRRS